VPGLTVRAALEVPALAGARVLAGASGLDRVVHGANIMEVPDILPWVKPHELLLTTGYPLRNTPNGLPQLVVDLHGRGLSALGVKLHRYLDELPPAMLAEADRLGLPVLLLPDAVGFDDILNQVLTQVLDRQAEALRRTWAVHDALLSVVLDGGGLDELTGEISSVLAAAVRITTPDGQVLARAGAHDDERPDREVAAPIVAGRVDHGRIIASSADRELDEDDVSVLERAATVAALVVTKELAVTAVEDKYRSDFLRDVLAGRAGDSDRVVGHCASLGWDVDRRLVVVVAELDPDEPASMSAGVEQRPVQERLALGWRSVVQQRDPSAAVVGFSQEVVVLLGVADPAEADRTVRELVRRVAGDGAGGRRSFSTGVSRVVEDPDGLPEAYEQALRAVHVGRRMHGRSAIAHFDGLGTFRLLSLIPDAGELRGFARETLRELADETHHEMADLRHTLQVLLDTNLNVAEAARELHFHYNTLRYRIGKLERLVGPFTTDPHLRLDLALALKVMQMRGIFATGRE